MEGLALMVCTERAYYVHNEDGAGADYERVGADSELETSDRRHL